MIQDILILTFLIILSAFFSSAEIALFSISPLKVKHMVDKNIQGAKTIKYLKDRQRKLLSAILIGNNLVNIGASVFATTIAISFFGDSTIGIVTGIMTFVILVFGEIIPKSFAIAHAEPLAILFAKPLKFLMWLLYPLIILLDTITKLLRIDTVKGSPIITEEELKSYVTAGEEIGQISEQEKDIIHKVFRFDDISVKEIMTPRTEMTILNSKMKVKEVINKVIHSGYSRYPVYENNRDKIVGIAHAWDMFKTISQGKPDTMMKDIMKTPLMVPETMRVDELLKHFLKRKHHMAIVIDEYGGTAGTVTLEDALEEIVGEIMDERDMVKPDMVKLNRKTWRVFGKMDIDKFFENFSITRKKGDFDTVNGYFLERIKKIPNEGDEIKFKKYRAVIEEMSGNRIKTIKLIKK